MSLIILTEHKSPRLQEIPFNFRSANPFIEYVSEGFNKQS